MEDRDNIVISEKLKELSHKMGELEKAVAESDSTLDDAVLEKIGVAIKAIVLGLEKTIDALISLVNRFFN